MLKNMLIRSGIVITGMVITQVILDKLEKNYLENDKLTKGEGRAITVEVDNEHCTGTETYYVK